MSHPPQGSVQGRRLFLALQPDENVRAACARTGRDLAIRMQPVHRRLVAAENLHLTLEFLGHSVTPGQEQAVRDAAANVPGEPFTMTLDVASSFAGASVWWLGPRTPPDALMAFRANLHQRLSGLGLHLERTRFSPHVTILKTASKLPPTRIEPIAWAVHDFVLMLSHIGPDGARYEMLQRWPLQQKAAKQLALL